MNRIKFFFGLLAAGAVYSTSAQSLEFTNLTLSTTPNLFHGMTNRLDGVVYGGTSNFLAVGANQIYVIGNFQPGQTLMATSDWVTNQILPTRGLNLTSVALGAGLFVATGESNNVFSAANNFTPGGLAWAKDFKIFNNNLVSPAIAFNANKFVAAGELDQVAVSGTNLPATFWTLWNPVNPDFAESFRGLTAYGTNGFAVCGRYADVRLSNDGTNWQTAVSGLNGLPSLFPDLYSICYNGTMFVSVGATNASSTINGAIMASTNNAGTNWHTVYVNNTAGTAINAVTYTGSGFIAVGSKGQVLTSSNGVTWTALANAVSPNNVNLNGIAFATNGYMVGVGEIVGDNGTVILAGTPPPAPINPVNETNCASFPNDPSYTPLSVTPVTDANHPAGTITVDWYDAQGNLVASGTTNFTPTVNPNMVGINTPSNIVFNVQERDLRTGFTTTNPTQVTLQIIPRPTATLSALNTEVCNIGESFTVTNTLTGVGPWTIYWNDGTIQTASGAAPAQITRVINPTNSFANASSNNLYFVTVVTNADMCMGNVAGDIVGQDSVIVDPRPTATLLPLDITNCNDGSSDMLTADLTGIGPWTVHWNDGTIQTNSQIGSGPSVLTRMVFPTNSIGANAPSNNVYYITAVVNADTCAGNLPGDISGTNLIVINPRPTATLVSVNVTNCNTGPSYTLTNTLTGIGPWTVTWNDGFNQSTSGTGPVTLTRTVNPTNTLANASSNNVYSVATVTDNSDSCVGNQPGDITGMAQFLINPLPTVTLTISTNDFAVSTNGVSTGLLEQVSQAGPVDYNVLAGFQYLQGGTPVAIGSQTLSVTNHLAFTGLGPWVVTLSDGNTTTTLTNVASSGVYVWQETISTNTDTNFTFSASSLTDSNSGCAGTATNVYSVIVYDAPTALVSGTNTACGNGSDVITVSAALGGFGPWTNVIWSDGFTNSLVTTSPFNRTVTAPTNNSFAPITTNYTIVSLTDANGATTTSGNDLTGAATLIVDPFLMFAPTPIVDTNYSCPDVGVSLAVSVPPGFTADWFADPTLLTNLAVGVTNYAAAIANAPGTNVYYVTMRYNDAFSQTNCAPDIATNIYLVAAACTNAISSITLSGTNAVVSWSGNYILQSTTNLNPPVIWMNVSTGALGPNSLTNPVTTPPNEFFRLYAPTN